VPRVTILTEIPTPVRDPLWARLSCEPDLSLRVLYCAATERGRSWRAEWPMPPDWVVLPGKVLHWSGDPRGTKWNPSVWSRLSEDQPDVVLVGGWGQPTMLAAAAFCRARSVPYVLFTETHLLHPRPLWRRALKLPLASWMVAGQAAALPAGTASRDCLVHYGADPDRCFLFPYTPDAEELALRSRALEPRREELRATFSLAGREVVLFCGRLSPEKGPDVLLRAFASLRARRPRALLWLVGDGPLRRPLEAEVARLDLPDAVRFEGFLPPSRLAEVYVAADLLCVPSRWEMWGAVVNEAMACGRPVVASRRVGAARDLLDETTGRTFPEEDPEALAGTVEEVLCLGAEERGRMGEAARRRALAAGFPLCIASFRRALETALGGRG